MKTLITLATIPLLLTACAWNHYSTTTTKTKTPTSEISTTRTENYTHSLLSTTAFKGMYVGTNGGLRIIGLATDPNPQAITATAEGIGTIAGAAAAEMAARQQKAKAEQP